MPFTPLAYKRQDYRDSSETRRCMNHFYRNVTGLGNVAVSRHAQERMEADGISQEAFDRVLLTPVLMSAFKMSGALFVPRRRMAQAVGWMRRAGDRTRRRRLNKLSCAGWYRMTVVSSWGCLTL